MNLIGKMLNNRYEILEKIGIGGMATVYKAKCHVLNRYVAVKILKDEFTTDTEFIKKFNSEGQSAASLSHPNIVSIYDVGNEDNLYYIVMELIQGKTLKEIIVEDGILSWKWSVNIAIQIASALEVAHKNNIIHRDIKPHNIIITEDGIAKVTDFGIAKAVSNSTITAFGTTIGSVHYFSPEHARGGYTDAKSDLYSLGIVMYEMLTNRVPFDADTPVSVALKQVQEEPIEPIKLNPEIPISVNKIILKAMQKDPNYRYQSATEMLEDLKRALKEPNEDFVEIHKIANSSPTQKIPTIFDIDNDGRRTSKSNSNKSGNGKIKEFFMKHKALKVLIMILFAIGLFFGAMFVTLKIFSNSRPVQVQIPNVVTNEAGENISEDDAKKILEEAGLTNYIIEYSDSDTVEKGYVISQNPQYQNNYMVNVTEEVKIAVSKGSIDEQLAEKIKNTTVKLPKKMIGKNKDELISEFEKITEDLDEDLVIKYEINEEFNEEVEAGIVTDVDHEGGEEITLDTVLNIVVSKGSQFADVTVPSVMNKSEAEARAILEGLNLVVNIEYTENTTKNDGIVLSQSEKANKVIKEGNSINLVVNKLPAKSTVTISVNLKSLMKYTPPEPEVVTVEVPVETDTENASNTTTDAADNTTNTENTNTTVTTPKTTTKTITKDPEIKSAKVVIKVGDDIIYSETKKLTETAISANYTTSGIREIKVYVDDVVKFNRSVDFSAGNQTVVVE